MPPPSFTPWKAVKIRPGSWIGVTRTSALSLFRINFHKQNYQLFACHCHQTNSTFGVFLALGLSDNICSFFLSFPSGRVKVTISGVV